MTFVRNFTKLKKKLHNYNCDTSGLLNKDRVTSCGVCGIIRFNLKCPVKGNIQAGQ